MAGSELHVVTGAFGFSGRRIARELLSRGHAVRSLTGHPEKGRALQSRVAAFPFDFERPERMVSALRGADVFHNTFWIRFERGEKSFDWAVRCSRSLFEAAREAGVRRIVHVSILHPDPASPYPYYRGKARVEAALIDVGVPHSVLRPALLFGQGDVLVNNLAWLARRFPMLAVPGSGRYRIRPIHVGDLARLAADEGEREEGRRVRRAVGPERLRFRRMVRQIGRAVGEDVEVVAVSPRTMLVLAKLLGLWRRDVVLTRQEISALQDGLLDCEGPAAGDRELGTWLGRHGSSVGTRWASELGRHYR